MVIEIKPEQVNVAKPLGSPTTAEPTHPQDSVLEAEGVSIYYGERPALRDVTLSVRRNSVMAIIGPSGCGKSTLLRCFNRMNDLIRGSHLEGKVLFNGQDIYASNVDPTELRSRIGMVFQKPNPFPKSIFENVAFGLRINGFRGNLRDRVEQALRRAALWEEVSDRLGSSALSLSGGQQQRLCIARALAVEPEVILMDEPASALDPSATYRIEELIDKLKEDYTILIVTHNMQQAARVSDMTVFLLAGEERTGELIEIGPTSQIFTNPRDKRTEDYITGRFG